MAAFSMDAEKAAISSEQPMDGLRGSKRCTCIHERRVIPAPVAGMVRVAYKNPQGQITTPAQLLAAQF